MGGVLRYLETALSGMTKWGFYFDTLILRYLDTALSLLKTTLGRHPTGVLEAHAKARNRLIRDPESGIGPRRTIRYLQ